MKKVIVTDQFKQRLDPEFFEEFADVELITAYSNEQALNLHHSNKADLIITELHGAGMNAVQLCSQLREEEGMRGVAVIIYCRDNEQERAESLRCRAAAVLTLPVSRMLLRERMGHLLSVPPRRTYSGMFSALRVSGPDRATIDCRMENISVTGMLIEASADLQKGEKLDCTLTLPSEQPFVLKAEVVRASMDEAPSGRTRYGIRFFRLNPVAQKAIEHIVSHPA